jgi:uncharacterized protein (UPF0261 family)
VVSLGALDLVCMGPAATIPGQFSGRTFYRHTPEMTCMRTTPDECAELGRRIARKLNATLGPTALFIPRRGTSLLATEGQVFYDPNADEALFEALRANIDPDRVEVHELDLDINDSKFGLEMANRLHDLFQHR